MNVFHKPLSTYSVMIHHSTTVCMCHFSSIKLLFLLFVCCHRLLLIVYIKKTWVILGLGEALPYQPSPERLVLHLPEAHLLLAAGPGSALYRWVGGLCGEHQKLISIRVTTRLHDTAHFTFTEFADGLCCTLEEPCFILGSDNITSSSSSSTTQMTSLMPLTIRRPSISWKDMSRCRIFLAWLRERRPQVRAFVAH